MKVPYSMDDNEPDLHCGMGGYRDEYDYPNYEHDGDSLAQATTIIDRNDYEPLEYTHSQVMKMINQSRVEPDELEFKLQKAIDLLICVSEVMPEMNEAYATALRTAIRQFLEVQSC